MNKPIYRAISVITIAMIVVILMVDNHANARLEIYHPVDFGPKSRKVK